MTIFMGTTQVEALKTIGQIYACLVRAGASSTSTEYGSNGSIAAVRFSMEPPKAPFAVSFRLPCRTEKLLKQLRNDGAQAERTAWRQVLRWVEAQCAMIDAGMVQTHEVFLPYASLPGSDQTLFQAWESQGKLLIAAPEAVDRA